jgi:S1-C subfamily serine protease
LEQTTFFNQQWLKSVVSIERYYDKNKFKPIGTGFLISSENNNMLLVSAKHVVTDDKGRVKNGLVYRINLQDEKSIVIEDKELIGMGGGNWFLSKSADLAVRFMPSSKKADVLKIPQNLFLKEKNVQPGTPSLMLGFPMGLRSEKYATPIVRRAVVALKRSDYFIIDGFAFPGNSGGPVLYMPAHQIGGIKLNNYINEQLLLGVVSSYIPYKDTAISLQTKRPRITFEENSGLTIVIPSDEILKLLNRYDVKELDKNLKK